MSQPPSKAAGEISDNRPNERCKGSLPFKVCSGETVIRPAITAYGVVLVPE